MASYLSNIKDEEDELPEFGEKVFVLSVDKLLAARRKFDVTSPEDNWYWEINTTGDLLEDDDYKLYYHKSLFTYWTTFPEFEDE